eukprot:TRINITY_DN5078_c0_g1_i1.p1 TRINITY_DN5078_c0_g1~~TRINITY_DN5078_c0_g1_i1.p1  ORF type:complete len:200 (+),score=63.12 TRINITY_DN5078_c0_g1_i1:91-690(+)
MAERKIKVAIVYYSLYGHVHTLAKAIAEGVKEAGAEAVLLRAADLTPKDNPTGEYYTIPVAKPEDLEAADAVIFGAPTRFGIMAAPLKAFFDSLGGLWMKNALVGKPAGFFTSTATQHGGNEATILSAIPPLLHLGFIFVGLPYTFAGQKSETEITGCSPYGVSTIAGGMGGRQPSTNELDGARFHGKHVAQIAAKLAK